MSDMLSFNHAEYIIYHIEHKQQSHAVNTGQSYKMQIYQQNKCYYLTCHAAFQ